MDNWEQLLRTTAVISGRFFIGQLGTTAAERPPSWICQLASKNYGSLLGNWKLGTSFLNLNNCNKQWVFFGQMAFLNIKRSLYLTSNWEQLRPRWSGRIGNLLRTTTVVAKWPPSWTVKGHYIWQATGKNYYGRDFLRTTTVAKRPLFYWTNGNIYGREAAAFLNWATG